MRKQDKMEMRQEKRMSFSDSCRFVKRYNGETDCMERWTGASGRAKENAKGRDKHAV